MNQTSTACTASVFIAMCTFSGNSPTGSGGTAERTCDCSSLISAINRTVILGIALYLQ